MSQKETAAPKTRADKGLIFVVDDEPMLLELASVILEPEGFTVRTFRDPETAAHAFQASKPAPILVITDYSMHSMSGMDLINACRAIKSTQPILLVSGTVDEHVFHRSPEKPDLFLAKPYQPWQLVEAVQAVLKK
jgi:DNA-binding response OmpR family regulator